MNASLDRRLFGLVLMPWFLAVSGCAGTTNNSDRGSTLHLRDERISPDAGQTRGDKRVAVHVAAYLDGRAAAPSRKVGEIHSTVVDMHRPELVLDRDISSVVTSAISDTLTARGFEVSRDTEGPAARGADALRLSGTIRTFALDIGGRDRLAIAVETTVRAGNGSVLWSGVVSETADRYAGVSGNTKDSIAEYLTTGMKAVANKTAVQVHDAARQAHPDLLGPSFSPPHAVERADQVAPAVMSAPSQAPGRAGAAAAAAGRLSVVTTPPRAKVYLGDVYWGLSPLDLELAPDIYLLRVTLDGYKAAAEKISVRKATTTELEIVLER
jgi:PEGA domain